jgi:hypothetical protein
MYKVLIENSMTIIYEDLGEENFKDNRIVGTLINEPGIKEFLELLPINEYILDTSGIVLGKKTYTTLNKKQAFYMYNEIFKLQEKEKKDALKKVKSRY